jgi:hypothetical protein
VRWLFSWRLFCIDATLMLYLLAIFGTSLSYGINVTSTMVINGIVKCVQTML